MNEKDLEKMVYAHDKHLDKLTNNIANLTHSVTDTNSKLDDVIQVITRQNLLAERLTVIDKETREAFQRIYTRVGKIESYNDTRDNTGCNMVRQVVDANKNVEEDIKELSKSSSARLYKAASGVVLLIAAILTYVMYDIHDNAERVSNNRNAITKVELNVNAHIESNKALRKYSDMRIENIISAVEKNIRATK